MPADPANSGAFELHVPQSIRASLIESYGRYYESISGIDRQKLVDDALSPVKAEKQAEVLERHVALTGRRVLEVGAGQGTNMIVWSRKYGADVTAIEPSSPGFDDSFELARELLAANGLDPERVVDAVGEKLPFDDDTFDIVYSANVLEHTSDPAKVLRESIRVLRPGGTMQFVFPNYHSYFDGHYGVLHPPIPWPGFFPWYVKAVFGRDPAFAKTLRTEINVGWVRRQIDGWRNDLDVEIVDLGQALFMERLASLQFAAWGSLGRLQALLGMIGMRQLRSLLGRLVIALRGWTPIVLTLRKRS